MTNGTVSVRPATAADADAVRHQAVAAWGRPVVVGHGTAYDLTTLPALLAERDGRAVGMLAYQVVDSALEVVSISATERAGGVGSALLAEAVRAGIGHGCRRLWLVTSNDNLDALRFYQRRGLRIVAVRPGGVDRARELKPDIPLVGAYGIPLHDELVLEMAL